MGEYCKSVKCPLYEDGVCKSHNDHTKKADGHIECDYDRGVLPYTAHARKQNKPICEIIFDIPYYFCGNCKIMLNMYGKKAKYCSECGCAVEWSDGKHT